MKKYELKCIDGKIFCYANDVETKEWALHNVAGRGVCLFVHNARVADAKDIIFTGFTHDEVKALVHATKEVDPSGVAVWSEKLKAPNGNTIIKAKRHNGEIVYTEMDKDGHIVKSYIGKE